MKAGRLLIGLYGMVAASAGAARGEDDLPKLFRDVEEIRKHIEQIAPSHRALEDARREAAREREIAGELRVRLAAAEAELEALRKANATLERLTRARESGPVGGVRQATERATVEIRGKISSVADAGLYVVSIGTDDGVRQGFVLDVTRPGEGGLRLGTVTLVRTYGRQSIAQFKAAGKDRPEVGDEVSTRVVPN